VAGDPLVKAGLVAESSVELLEETQPGEAERLAVGYGYK
jgi:hypothetical protein